MDKNCGNCKFWGEYEYSDYEIRKCQRIKMFWDSTEWAENGEDRVFLDDSKAFVQDGSDYMAYLLSKEDFYCNMWEEK